MTPELPHAQLDWDDQGRPHSRVFDDVYFSDQSGLDETRYVFIEQNRLSERFAALKANEKLVIGETGFGRLGSEPIGDVAHVLVAQGGGHAGHHGVGTLARFKFLQLLDQVIWVLLRQLRVGRRTGVAICTMAGRANGGVGGFTFGQINLGSRGYRFYPSL